jgi:hypothetical protein
MITLCAALMALGGTAAAERLRCQSQGYCTLERECFPDSSVMQVEIAPDGSARYAWMSGDMMWFEAPGTRKGAIRVWVNQSLDGAAQTLVIGDSGEGTFQIATDFEGMFYASMQVLACRGK